MILKIEFLDSGNSKCIIQAPVIAICQVGKSTSYHLEIPKLFELELNYISEMVVIKEYDSWAIFAVTEGDGATLEFDDHVNVEEIDKFGFN